MKKIAILFFLPGVILLGACKGNHSTSEKQTPKTEVETIKKLLVANKATVIDVRTSEEFSGGHIPNSKNIPLHLLEYSIDSLKQYENIVVVCRSGNRSGKAKKQLSEAGFTNVYDGKAWDSLQKLLK